jgi:hypothetical protein
MIIIHILMDFVIGAKVINICEIKTGRGRMARHALAGLPFARMKFLPIFVEKWQENKKIDL